MSDVTYGELYSATSRGAVPADAKIAVELADGSASYGHDIGELAASTAFSDLYVASSGSVESVNGQTGVVVLDNTDVGADAAGAAAAVASDLTSHLNDTSDAHDASAISVADSGGYITATDVEAALAEGFNGKCAVNVVAASGSTETLTLHPIQKVTMDQNCTFTFPTPTTAGHVFMLHLIGAFTPTWPGTVDWPSATPPTYATPSIFVFVTDDTGTSWFGAMVGSGYG